MLYPGNNYTGYISSKSYSNISAAPIMYSEETNKNWKKSSSKF